MRSVGALGGVAGTGGGKVAELAVKIVVVCGLQVPQASSSKSSTAMVEAAAPADEAAWDTALGGVIGSGPLQDRPRGVQHESSDPSVPPGLGSKEQPGPSRSSCFPRPGLVLLPFLLLSPLLRLARLHSRCRR